MWTVSFGICVDRAMLVDTDVLVWFFRGAESARLAVAGHADVGLSAVSYMELLQGVRDKNELLGLRRAIGDNGWRVIPVCEGVSHRAVLYVERHALAHGMRLADALIAATAVEAGEALMTANVRHYRFLPDVDVRHYQP